MNRGKLCLYQGFIEMTLLIFFSLFPVFQTRKPNSNNKTENELYIYIYIYIYIYYKSPCWNPFKNISINIYIYIHRNIFLQISTRWFTCWKGVWCSAKYPAFVNSALATFVLNVLVYLTTNVPNLIADFAVFMWAISIDLFAFFNLTSQQFVSKHSNNRTDPLHPAVTNL